MEFRNAVFVVTEDYSCPAYNVGEEFVVRDAVLSFERNKRACMILLQTLLNILASSDSPLHRRIIAPQLRQNKFECGGCTGMIRFEYKKEHAYSTLQMNLLKVAEKRARQLVIEEFFVLLREMELFDPLDDADLRDLAFLMKLTRYAANKVIIEEGEPGTHFYVILSGEVAVVKKEGELVAELGPGDIFGEMSLLSGEPAYPSVCSTTSVQLAVLKARDFKYVLSNYPTLQIFFYRLLVNRAQTNIIRSGQISSGMSGELVHISPVELFQLINSSSKSGKVDLLLPEGQACVLFHEGEIVHAVCGKLQGKEALFALLAKKKGTFAYTAQMPGEYKKKPILGGFMGLLMEGLQRLDEGGAEEEQGGSSQ